MIPGYEKHKEIATKTLIANTEEETELPVLIKFGDYWQPGLLIEQDNVENAVVTIHKTDGNEIYIVPIQNIKILKETSPEQLKSVIKSSGKGLLACK